ncbi:dTMP kinase [candidate division WOR-1 bacterium RIFCSPLOWO2_02_FULL_46_20]|uniref:Thymidylate kinase n=2 Tax=Saganbacteria TaxID=1703751 RepID=A0A1F4R3Y3_UNCSA|nr:MAG: dTMP kinase [candidate division WOR-1 bacterium RIFCSPHIGHO2_02_FULL_45_12]OGC02887.1 MAG: dTMP kinase [candidate division WOR-1 bacterium RIFCSPLOWO2_02_FULL_46_20]OGC08278.1 MAG: dTMP kinase [candidate division WOR-1 bacterium RIFCSPLOWO2_12_FULL_45_9]
MFITFEGPEGCGKSTHSKKIKHYLEEEGHQVLLTQEPGGTQVGKQIRTMLLDPRSVFDETTEVYLFAADRSEHVTKIIIPALAAGKIVISDRFTDSTVAYQIGGRGLPEDLVRYINMVSSRGLVPDLTILLDISPENGLKRALQTGAKDRFEKEALEFHQRIRHKYLAIAKDNPARVKVVNTDETEVEKVQSKIRRIIVEQINEKFGNKK